MIQGLVLQADLELLLRRLSVFFFFSFFGQDMITKC